MEFYVDVKFMDVEAPAHKSDPFVLYVVNYTLPDSANKLIETEFPFHLRYQKAAEDSRYKEVRFGDAYSDVQMLYLCKGHINSNWKKFPLNSGEWIPVSFKVLYISICLILLFFVLLLLLKPQVHTFNK